MVFQLSLTNPPQVLKEGDHPSFQLKQAKKIDKERGHVDASMKGAQHVKLRGSDSLLKKIQNEKKVLDEVFGNLADPTMKGSIINRGKINHLTFLHILKRKKKYYLLKNILGAKPTTRRGMGLRNSGGVRSSLMQLKTSVFS